MFSGLQESQLKGALEAMLFVTDEPVSIITLADMLEVEPKEVEAILVDLRKQFEEDERGIQLREVAGGWRLFTHPVYHELIERYVVSWDTRRLSQAAMETLAIVAYTQPVTRSGVASVRGVSSDSSINSLIEKGLVREAGVDDSPGNPTLYATTRTFLEKFGLRSTDDLPNIDDYAPDEETKAFIKERLSATHGRAWNPSEHDEATTPDNLLSEAVDIEVASTTSERFDSDDEEGASFAQGQAASLLASALASQMGVVEKIDFDKLEFEE